MNDVRLDPRQVPTRAELLLAAGLGKDAPGRPIYARLEPDDHDDASAEAVPGALRHQPARVAVDPSTPTTHLDPP